MEEELQRAVGTPQEQISYCCRALSLKFCLYNMPGNYFSVFQSIFEVVGKIATRRNLVNEAGEPRLPNGRSCFEVLFTKSRFSIRKLETCILGFSLLSLQPVERATRLISPKRLFKPLLISTNCMFHTTTEQMCFNIEHMVHAIMLTIWYLSNRKRFPCLHSLI